jgi:hypothetical protein
MNIRSLTVALLAVAGLGAVSAPAFAQDSRYDPSRVWYVTGVDVLDGQFENYTAWLADEWMKFRKLGAEYGNEVGYHVLVNTTPRDGEPDLYLVTIHKDFAKIAEGLATEKKVNEAMSKDRRAFEKEGAARAPMRKVMSTIELMELTLK